MTIKHRGGIFRVGGKLVDSAGKEIPAAQQPKELKETTAEKDEPTGGSRSGRTKEPPAPPAPPATDDLAEDFPGREYLVAAGLTTRAAVAAKKDEELDAVPNIGPATIAEIREALKA